MQGHTLLKKILYLYNILTKCPYTLIIQHGLQCKLCFSTLNKWKQTLIWQLFNLHSNIYLRLEIVAQHWNK